MDQTSESTAEIKPAEATVLDQDDSSDEHEDMPPLESVKEAIKEEQAAKPHNKNIKGVKAEGDSDAEEETVEEGKDGWTDILSNGELRKKIIKEAPEPGRPPRGAKVTIRLVTRVYDGPKEGTPAEPSSTVITGESFDRFDVIIGDNDLYQGLDLMLPLMDKGETARLLIKSRFAYGASGNKTLGIPADSMLDLEVEIIDVLKYDDSPLAGNPLAGNPDPEPGEPNPILAHEALPDRLRIGNYKKERGNFWFGRGEYSLAIQCYRGATRFLDASDEELALADRAKNGKLVEQSPEVADKIRDIEELIDKRAQSFNNLAATQMKMQAYDAAFRSVEDSLLLRPENTKALYRRAKILLEKGDIDEAIADLEKAAKIDPTSEVISQELDRLKKILARQLKEQRQLYKRMMQVKDDDQPQKGDAAAAKQSKDGSSKGGRASSSSSKTTSAKSKSKSSSWLPFSATATLGAVGAVAAAVVLPSLYVYLK
ncbi:Peptidyl-prolyl cis-trans isomerase fkbp8 [Tyrophagus putrescentiae]|nr:Peptidyl-prolyl cis-trans isomerase fkbp8 [Tyrophagus putrescentiae]